MSINKYRENIVEGLKYYYLQSGKKEIIIICIGTPKNTGDSLGPFIGTELSKLDLNVKVYGTLESPVHALNVEDKYEVIQNNHPNAFIIGIDAALGETEDIGKIFFRSHGIRPGYGVDKNLGTSGHVSVVGIVADCQMDILLDMIEKNVMCNIADKIINELNKLFEEFNLFKDVKLNAI